MTIQEQIKILQAIADGKKIERYKKDPLQQQWEPVLCPLDIINGYKCLDFIKYSYRIKPEPRTFWVNQYKDSFGDLYTTEEEAKSKSIDTKVRIIKLVEVLE
jgi:hypothetical protein